MLLRLSLIVKSLAFDTQLPEFFSDILSRCRTAVGEYTTLLLVVIRLLELWLVEDSSASTVLVTSTETSARSSMGMTRDVDASMSRDSVRLRERRREIIPPTLLEIDCRPMVCTRVVCASSTMLSSISRRSSDYNESPLPRACVPCIQEWKNVSASAMALERLRTPRRQRGAHGYGTGTTTYSCLYLVEASSTHNHTRLP